MATGNAHVLIDFLRTLSLEALPRDVVERGEACLLDALGCGIFGSDQDWSKIVAEEMLVESCGGKCTLIGRSEQLPAAPAAFCNGTAVHGFELDDLIAESIVHPAAAVVPAALAAAEATDAPGARLLLGIIAGYETMHRVGVAMGVEPSRRGFHATSVVGPIAASVAAGVVMGLDGGDLLSAIGLASSAASGIKNFATGHGGGMVKRLQLGRSAEAGVRTCQLAKRGFSGPPYAIDGTFGILEVFGGAGAKPERLTRGLGHEWAVRDVWFKGYPMCGWLHTMAQALLQLRGSKPLPADDVKGVRVGVSSYAARNNREAAPIDTMGAQYSIPFCAATSLLGDPRDPSSFSPAAVANPVTREVASRVEIVVDPEIEAVYPAKFGAAVELTFASGESRRAVVMECHGTPEEPCSEAELVAKFTMLAEKRLGKFRASEIVERVHNIAIASSVKDLTRLLH